MFFFIINYNDHHENVKQNRKLEEGVGHILPYLVLHSASCQRGPVGSTGLIVTSNERNTYNTIITRDCKLHDAGITLNNNKAG